MAERAPNQLEAKFKSFERGMNYGLSAELLPPNQLSLLVNGTTRGGLPRTRPGYNRLTLDWPEDLTKQRFQHAGYYQPDFGAECLMAVIDGRVFRITPGFDSATVVDVSIAGDLNPTNQLGGWSTQAECFWVYQDGQTPVFIYDGAISRRAGPGELKPGTVITYGMGRVWYARPDGFSFRAGDLVRGPTGTPLYQYRDAVLKETENTFLNEGGDFSVPSNAGRIRAMRFLALMDTSLGQGPLQVFTPNSIFSVNAPVDRTTWKDLTYPIMTQSLIDYGALAQLSTTQVNTDVFFRSLDGIRSYIISRREFREWGNTPQSFEMQGILNIDQTDLLDFSSAIVFDNRLLMTMSPAYNDLGVYHRGLVALNFDEVSGLVQSQPPGYDGIWTGVKILQLVKGKFGGVERAFAFVRGRDDTIELWEISRDAIFDRGDTPIDWALELPRVSFGDDYQIKKLARGDMSASDIVGPVAFNVAYRPDGDLCWRDWANWSVCALHEDCQTGNECTAPKSYRPQYRPRMGWGTPADDCDTVVNKPTRNLFEAQIRLAITGHCTIDRSRIICDAMQQSPHTPCLGEEPCKGVECCALPLFDYESDPAE